MNPEPIQIGRKKPDEIVIETDPVCGMKVLPDSAAGSFLYQEKTYHFCSLGCLNRFKQTPEFYLQPQKPQEKAESKEIEYTCPMHPEIIQIGFGMCPICGMALEPKSFSLEEDTSEYDEMKRRFWICALLTLPIFLSSMAEMIWPMPGWVLYLQLILSIPVVIWGGKPFFERAWASLKNKSPNMFTLIGVGVGAAFLYSIGRLFFPHAQHDVYFEASAVIITLALLGQVLELKARGQTNSALRELLQLTPKRALAIFADDSEHEIPIEEIQAGARIRVRANERIAVDGIILEGKSAIDESMISGEAIPVMKEAGASVIGGTLNQQGSFIMRAEKIGRETMLSQIVQMVSEAQRSKAPIQNLADKVSLYFVPAVVVVSILTFAVWAMLGSFAFGFVSAVSVLIIACPCALGLATPMSIMVATGRGARSGILVKNAEALQLLEKIDVLLTDKTGTLTIGKPEVISIEAKGDYKEEEILRLAASIEKSSEHPLAFAIVKEAEKRGLKLEKAGNFRSITGKGVAGEIDSQEIEVSSFADNSQKYEGKSLVSISINGELAGVIAIADKIKDSAKESIDQLKGQNIEIVMLTGDNESAANAVAKELGIEKVFAGILPQDKARIIKEMQAQGKRVAMAGDGVNDAIALTQADIGIAMASGNEIAIESADLTLLKGDIRGIIRAIRLSKDTMKNIRQNLFFAFAYNLLGVPIAAGILYPVFGWLLSPMIASLAMTFSSVSVIGNALRLKSRPSKK